MALGGLSQKMAKNQQFIQGLQGELERSKALIEQSQQDLKQKKQQQPSLVEDIAAAEKKLSHFQNKWQQTQTALGESADQMHQLHSKSSTLQQQISEKKLASQNEESSVEALRSYIQERYQCDLLEFLQSHQEWVQALSVDEFQKIKKESEALLKRLGSLGSVNLAAICEYDDLKKRYDFLFDQVKDLENSREKITKVIQRIDDFCSKRFHETFHLINERFQKVYPALFGGGSASLTLVPYEEIGEVGVDISAQPPGKKMQNINLLSGGEKAMTAVSLLFAIFLINPSPFCLLDEVDAPLDDSNVSRFNDLVRQMSKQSQMILVTHNKSTMAACSHLFGVTMEEKGVSKVVSVNLESLALSSENALTL